MPDNLNCAAGVACEDRSLVHAVDAGAESEVWFTDRAARRAALFASTPYVVGAMAWFHDRSVLRALARCRGVGFVVTSEKGGARYHAARFGALPAFHAGERSAVKIVGKATGRRRALMHHKFAVGLDADKETPLWVLTGSYNPTEHARGSLENVLLVRAPALARVYLREYMRLFRVSRHVAAPRPRPRPRARATRARPRAPPDAQAIDSSASPPAAARA